MSHAAENAYRDREERGGARPVGLARARQVTRHGPASRRGTKRPASLRTRLDDQEGGLILYEMCFNLKLSGNEVYYIIFKILLVKIMLCSKLHCQKVLN